MYYTLLIAIIAALLVVIRALMYDPNYGILTATAGLLLIRLDPRPRAWILLDVDNFKAYNTLHGHSGADRRVRSVWHQGAERRQGERRTLRYLVVKIGGDEKFVSCRRGEEAEVIALIRARYAAVDMTITACVQAEGRDLDAMREAASLLILDSKRRDERNTVLYLS